MAKVQKLIKEKYIHSLIMQVLIFSWHVEIFKIIISLIYVNVIYYILLCNNNIK